MNDTMQHLIGQTKIIGTVLATFVTGQTLQDVNAIASIFAYICGGVASLVIAYYHIRKMKRE